MEKKQEGYDTILRMNLRHTLLLIGRSQAEERVMGNKMLGEIESAIRFFNMNFSWNIEVKEYAQQHLMSPYWFSQNFKKITGCSPAQYLISASEFIIPDKECVSATPESPCDLFRSMAFPIGEFSPAPMPLPTADRNKCGCNG